MEKRRKGRGRKEGGKGENRGARRKEGRKEEK